MVTLGNYIKKIRTNNKITQEEIASRAGLARSYISRLEDDKVKSPSAIVLIRLASALGISHYKIFEVAGYGDHLNDDLPPLGVYLRTKYPMLSDETITQIESFKAFLESNNRNEKVK